jgi:hypothetical protein
VRDEYIVYALGKYLLSREFDAQVGQEWVLDDQYRDMCHATIVAAFRLHQVRAEPEKYEEYFDDLFSLLVDGNGVVYEGDDYTDKWFRFIPGLKNQILEDVVSSNPAGEIILRLKTAGPQALYRALKKIVTEDEVAEQQPENVPMVADNELELILVPASDRIVKLGHNEAGDLEGASTDLIDLVASEVSIDGDLDLRDQIVGRLKAGRELIRGKTVEAYLLYQTMFTALGRLAEKYQNHAIGETAKKLWGLLLKHVFRTIL